MEAPGHMSPGHMSTRTSVSPGHMSTRTHVYPDKNARTPVARTHIPRTTGAASNTTTACSSADMNESRSYSGEGLRTNAMQCAGVFRRERNLF